MQRPVMNPMLMEDDDDSQVTPRRRRIQFGWLWRLIKRGLRLLFTEVISFRSRNKLRIEDGTPVQRFMRSLLYRLAFVPIILVLFVIVLVFAATHPPSAPPELDPMAQGVYYQPVTFMSEDGLQLEGWLVPAISAEQVLNEKEKLLQRRQPAVVLVHDFGASRQQVLPLVKPLHEMGIVVLIVGMRGTGGTSASAQTFGLRESGDVAAAVHMLRRRSFIDAANISVIGIGTGANAAVLAAERDPHIKTLVLDRPVNGFDNAFKNRVGHDRTWLDLLMPMCKWTFEMMYHVDADGLSMDRRVKTIESRPVLLFPASDTGPLNAQRVAAVQEFMKAHGFGSASAVATTD